MRIGDWHNLPEAVPLHAIARKVMGSKKFHQKGRFTDLSREWAALVGEPVAQKTRIRSFKDGRLVIEVASPSLMHELSGFMRESLLQALQETRAGRDIAEMRFRLSDNPRRKGM